MIDYAMQMCINADMPKKIPAEHRRRTLCVRVAPSTQHKLATIAAQHGLSIGQLVDCMTAMRQPPENRVGVAIAANGGNDIGRGTKSGI